MKLKQKMTESQNRPLQFPFLLSFNSMNTGVMPEVIRADYLLNILWLGNPQMDGVAEMGLTSLVSSTITKNLPKAKVIRELEDNIQKYKEEDISDRDIVLLSQRIARGQVENLGEINKLAKKNSSAFNAGIRDEARKEEAETARLREKVNSLANFYEKEIAKARQLSEELEETKRKLDEGKAELRNANEDELKQKDKEIESLKSAIQKQEERHAAELKRIELESRLRTRIILKSLGIVILIFLIVWFFASSSDSGNLMGRFLSWIKTLDDIQQYAVKGILPLFISALLIPLIVSLYKDCSGKGENGNAR